MVLAIQTTNHSSKTRVGAQVGIVFELHPCTGVLAANNEIGSCNK
jgi:hypothetical protein